MTQQALPLTRKGRPLRKLPAPKEHVLQMALVGHLRARCAPGWYWFHPANGEIRNKKTAAKLKAMGVRAGIFDLVLIAPDGTVRLLELKRQGERIRPGTPQHELKMHCIEHSWPYAVADNIDHALAVLEGWGVIRPALERIGA